ncbi:Pectinacetylesterase family protein [Euphorbia peplus]|nr:Pectinacetylesterase family protein [Euphorbia peplus]
MSYSTSALRLCFCLFFVLLLVEEIQAVEIPITILEKATQTGAVCLDGSPPAYFMQKGAPDKWLLIVEGGGWCESVETCVERRDTSRGSSKFFNKTAGFSGFLGGKKESNPDFWDFTRVKIKYCDGGSFTGDVEQVDPKTKLHFRGQRIWDAIMLDLMEKQGMKNAKHALLGGCSAGGLAAILHCDEFRSMFPKETNVKCAPDAGFFIEGTDISRNNSIREVYTNVATLHGSMKTLPKPCTSKMKPELCIFAQNVAQTMETPLFLINSPYDTWQVGHILAPHHVDTDNYWKDCRLNISKCTPMQMAKLQAFRQQFLNAVEQSVAKNPKNGYFIDSCFTHCQTSTATNWIGPKALKLNNTDMGKAVGDWFFDRLPKPFRVIDDPYPSKTICPSVSNSQ